MKEEKKRGKEDVEKGTSRRGEVPSVPFVAEGKGENSPAVARDRGVNICEEKNGKGKRRLDEGK